MEIPAGGGGQHPAEPGAHVPAGGAGVLALHRHRLCGGGGDELFPQPLLHLPQRRDLLALGGEVRGECGGVLFSRLLPGPAPGGLGAGGDGALPPVAGAPGQAGGHGPVHRAQLLRAAVFCLSEASVK